MYLLFFFYIKRPAGLRCAPLRGRREPLPLLRFLSFFFVRVKVRVEVVIGYIVPTLQRRTHQRAILNLWNGKCEIEYAAKSAGKKRGGGGTKNQYTFSSFLKSSAWMAFAAPCSRPFAAVDFVCDANVVVPRGFCLMTQSPRSSSGKLRLGGLRVHVQRFSLGKHPDPGVRATRHLSIILSRRLRKSVAAK
jgi:hypothetical protein